jgi:hypothetical protein
MTSALADGTITGGLSADQIVQKAKETYATLASYSDEGQIVDPVGGATTRFTTVLTRPNLYRIEWEQHDESLKGRDRFAVQTVWSTGAGNFLQIGLGSQWQPDRETALANAASPSGGAVTIVPMTFFNMKWPDTLDNSEGSWVLERNEPTDGVDCYVVTRNSRGHSTTLWIGKTDSLIRQAKTDISREAIQSAAASVDAELARHLHGFTLVETHTNIVVNHGYLRSDFTPSSYTFGIE